MNKARRIRVNLSEFAESNWQNSYLMFSALSWNQLMEYRRSTSKLQKEIEKKSREIKRLTAQLEKGEDVEDQIEELDTEVEKLSELQLKNIGAKLKDLYLEGSVYNPETKVDEPVGKEELMDIFDAGVITDLGERVFQGISKKN
jgi:hypothetical protein